MVKIAAWINTSSAFKAQILGKLLGDGCITKQAGRKPRFKFQHKEADFGWIYHCYNNLKGEIRLSPPNYKKVLDDRLTKGYNTSYYVQSKTSYIITHLREQWYPEGIKVIPFFMLDKYFTTESLAWWYMDDGHLKIKNNIPKKVILSTESFTNMENKNLISFLNKKYHLHFSTDKQNRLILYDQFQIQYFLSLINPHVHYSMSRKILSHSLYCSVDLSSRRTTIYLPQSINISRPTFEINNALDNLSTLISQFKTGIFYISYLETIYNLLSKNTTKGYQIILTKSHLADLEFLKQNTGLSYSHLTQICFIL